MCVQFNGSLQSHVPGICGSLNWPSARKKGMALQFKKHTKLNNVNLSYTKKKKILCKHPWYNYQIQIKTIKCFQVEHAHTYWSLAVNQNRKYYMMVLIKEEFKHGPDPFFYKKIRKTFQLSS